MGSNPSNAYFHIIVHQPQQADITGVVLIGRFNSLLAVSSLSDSYPPGRRIVLQRTSGSAAGLVNRAEQKKLAY